MVDEPVLIKNFFNRDSVGAVADAVAAAEPGFPVGTFMDGVFDNGWEGRELKERMRHVTVTLHDVLDRDYPAAIDVLLAAVLHAEGIGFPAMVFSDYVEAYGTDDWDTSVPALARFTTLVSAEFAIRPFIDAAQERTLDRMLEWAHDPDPAVRRLATEGSRPRLPWGMRLKSLVADPTPIIPILDLLRSDPDEAVRRSVANNLNDISKDHPGVAIAVLERWQETPDDHLEGLTRHALRTLLKKGDPAALRVMGFRPDAAVAVHHLAMDPDVVAIGGSARMTCRLESCSEAAEPLLVDYLIHYVKANGTTSPKVFKLATLTLEPGESVPLGRKVNFAQLSTRTHYPGTHRLEMQVNGTVVAGVDFVLLEPDG